MGEYYGDSLHITAEPEMGPSYGIPGPANLELGACDNGSGLGQAARWILVSRGGGRAAGHQRVPFRHPSMLWGTSRYKSLTDPVAQDGLEVVVVCSKPGYVQRLTATARQVNDEPPAAIIWMPADGSTRRSGAGSLSRRAVNLRVVPPLVRSGNGADGRTDGLGSL